MYKVAVIGDRDSVLVFKALGIDVFHPQGPEAIRDVIDRLARQNYGVIYITEQMAQLAAETISRFDHEMVPAIILIPSNQGSLGIGMNRIDRSVEKAVGSNIL